jgi:hypothetical protein
MSLQQVLPKEFAVKKVLDLSLLTKESDFYTVLAPLKEDTFADNTRLVFHHSQPLVRTFNDLPADSLIQLQKMLVYIDIPNFFCVIVSDDIKVKDELEFVCQHYAVNENPINLICLK